MNTLSSITALLALSNCQYRIYEIGRVIQKIAKTEFNKIEMGHLPYPSPIQGHAQFAIVFWQKNTNNPFIWFLKIPLDERGLLNQGAIHHFVTIIIEALGADLTTTTTEQQAQLLNSNPYHFTPAQYKMASFNAIIAKQLTQPVSQFYTTCQQYVANQQQWPNWQHLAAQGLADFAARLESDNNLNELLFAFAKLPINVVLPLCTALEHHQLPLPLVHQIIKRFKNAKDNEEQQHLLRALAASYDHQPVQQLVEQLLQQPISSELLIVISGRHWRLLNNVQVLIQFFDLLLLVDNNNELFSPIFKDLVAIPKIRPIIFQCMRQANRSQQFASAIGQLFH